MSILCIVQTLDINLFILPIFMYAKLSLKQVIIYSIRTNDALLFILHRVLDYMGTFVANFPILRNLMAVIFFINARQIYFIGQTFLVVVRAKSSIFV